MRPKRWSVRVATLLLAVFMLPALAPAADVREIRLIMTSMSPAGSRNSVFFNAWAKRVNADSQGTVKVEIKDGFSLANYSNVYDRVQSDVVQIGWALPVALGNQFPLTSLAALPLTYDNGVAGSLALWRLYKTGILNREYQDIVPLSMSVSPQASLHFRRVPKSPDDLSGIKMNVIAGKGQSDMVASLGGQPMSLQLSESYEALQRGTVDGITVGWSAVEIFKLTEVTSYHVNAELGGNAHVFFMSKRKFNSLPAAARAALEKNSGEAQSRAFGVLLDEEGEAAHALTKRTAGQKVVDLTPAQRANLSAKAAVLARAWADSRQDGQKALDTFRSLVAAAATEAR